MADEPKIDDLVQVCVGSTMAIGGALFLGVPHALMVAGSIIVLLGVAIDLRRHITRRDF